MKVYFLLIVISIPTIWALFPSGYFYTHDGAHHLIRLFHFYNELARGQFPVRWASDLAFGFGYPVFNYFYPLLYYLGSLLHFLGFSFENSIKIILGTSTIFSALAVYWWLRGHFNILPAFIASILYVYTPYRFSMMYVNGHFGALLELFIVPLILGLIQRILIKKNLKLLPLLSIFIAMYLTAHNFTALFFLPLIISYTFFLSIGIFRQSQFLYLFLAGLIGVGLSAFFIFPALFELRFINLSFGNVYNYQDHFPTLKQLIYSKWGYGYSAKGDLSGQSFQLGAAQQVSFLAVFFYLIHHLIFAKKEDKNNQKLAILMIGLTLVSIFLMLEQSDFIWKNIPILQSIQFPWRLLAIPMTTIPFLAAWIIQNKKGYWIILPILFLLILNNRNYLRTWEIKRYTLSNYLENWYQFYGSTDVAWEAKPIQAKTTPKLQGAGKISTSKDANINEQVTSGTEKRKFIIDSNFPQKVVINYFYFPSWKLFVDGKEAKISPTTPEGLITFDVNSGRHLILLLMAGTTLENLSNLVSLLSLILLLGETFYFSDVILKKPEF